MDSIEADFLLELQAIEAESLGWQPLEPGVYLHVSDESAAEVVITGQATAEMAGVNVLWVV